MRFRTGLPPATPGFPRPNENWSRLREPDLKRIALWAVLVGNVLAIAGAWGLGLLLPGDALPPLRFLTAFADCFPAVRGAGFLLPLVLFPLHELLHAVWFPRPLGSGTTFGASREVGAFYQELRPVLHPSRAAIWVEVKGAAARMATKQE